MSTSSNIRAAPPPIPTTQTRAAPPPAPADDNRRRAPRVDLNVEVGIDDDTNFYVGFGENISEGGLFIATYRLLPKGTEIALKFSLPDESTIEVHGVVRWLRDPHDPGSETTPGMGVEFVDLSDQAKARIFSYLKHRAPLFYPD